MADEILGETLNTVLEVFYRRKMSPKLVNVKDAIGEARKLVEEKIAKGENADEFVELCEVDGFKIYMAAGNAEKY